MRFRPKGTILFVYISFFQRICWWHFAIESNEIEESMFKCHWVSGSAVINGNSLFDWMHCKGPTILETLDGLHFILVFFIHSTIRVPLFSLMRNIQIRASKKFCMSPNYWDATNSQLFDGLFGLKVSSSALCSAWQRLFLFNSLHIQINL